MTRRLIDQATQGDPTALSLLVRTALRQGRSWEHTDVGAFGLDLTFKDGWGDGTGYGNGNGWGNGRGNGDHGGGTGNGGNRSHLGLKLRKLPPGDGYGDGIGYGWGEGSGSGEGL